MAESRRYSFTKFEILNDRESIASARKKYFVWITIVTVLFSITVVYFSIKLFVSPTYSNSLSLSPTSDTLSISKFYNPKPLLAKFRRTPEWDLSWNKTESQLEAIPEVLIQKMFEKNFEKIEDFIELDFLLHYKNLIRKNTRENLKEILNDYHSKLSLVQTSEDFVHFLKGLKSNKFKFYADYLKEKNLELNNFQNVFALTEELNHWYNYLSQLSVFLSGYDQQTQKNFFVNCTVSNFNNFTVTTQKLFLHFVYPFNITEKKLQEINEVIHEWAKPMKTEFGSSFVVFHGKVLLISDVNRVLRGLKTSPLKSVYFFAKDIVYLDDDIHLPGVNLAMIAPNWVFLKRSKINLSGLDGINMTVNAEFNQSGKPGNPGGNAGDFLGVGNPQEKYLFITANGGRGGNGQNGAKGQDGINNTRPDPPVNKPVCASKVSTFKNVFGQLITHYKVFNRLGCGTSGTDGGVGGQGGMGGVITLVTEKFIKIKTGLIGVSGSPGKAGAGGVGGRDGCFYEVFDVDDETLHRITRVKCPKGTVLPSGDFGKDAHNTHGQIFPPVKENLKTYECLTEFLRLSSGNFNPALLPVLKQLIQIPRYNPDDLNNIVDEFNLIEILNKSEFYDLFYEQVNKSTQQPTSQPVLTFLKSLTLARRTLLKSGVDFQFINFKNYLNLLKKSIKSTNEHSRVFQSSLYLKRKLEIKREEIQQNVKQIKLISDRIQPEGMGKLCGLVEAVMQYLLNETSDVKQLDLNLFRSCLMENPNNRKIFTKDLLTNNEKKIFNILENQKDVREHLLKVKDVLWAAEDSSEFSAEEKLCLRGLTDQLERFLALHYFTEWEELENLFLKSLYELKEGEGVGFWKIRLLNAMIALQCNLVMSADNVNFYPSVKYELSQNKSILDDVLAQITLMEQNGAPFSKNQLKAVFDKNSAVGGFYFWPNKEIRSALKSLFSGSEIHLQSTLSNHHVFDKNYLQFTSLKLEFECNRDENECQKQLTEILAGFKIEITHSGYSYYNWYGETHIVVSEKVNLMYSFRTRDNKQPEIYNSLYKKCQDGEIKLSPFTTWAVRFEPINKEFDFDDLLPFADKVNLRLIGSGTYTS